MENKIKIAHYGKFYFEEPCITNSNGCGAIFFSNCSLKCVFCQNYEISSQEKGKWIDESQFIKIIQELENQQVYAINLVNPTHFAKFIIRALKKYKPHIPVIWNSHGYESISTIKTVSPYVDIFLPDFKYIDNLKAIKYSHAKNYFEISSKAILYMSQLKPNVFDGDMLKSGVIIRHLILPLCSTDSCKILDYIKQNLPDAIVSIMSQYVPYGRAQDYPELNRKITKREYNRVLQHFLNLRLQGYSQTLDSASSEFIPKWNMID